ncbi:MAG: PAS domain S-box protein [Candidatus Helarchaeota archaeon]
MKLQNKIKFLIVDDEESICETLSYIFEEEGYIVESAKTGKEAIDKVNNDHFNAAIIDIKLPDMNGMDILRIFKKNYPDMVCMIITGNATIENAINALEEGADGYFIKPTRMKEVMLRVKQALEKQRLKYEIQESEEKFRKIFESIPDLFFLISNDTTILDYRGKENGAFLHSEQFLGKKLVDVMPSKISDSIIHAVKENISTKQPQIIEYSTEKNNNSTRFFEARFASFSEDRVVVFVRDITERKKAEKEMRIKDLAIESSLNAMIILDLDGKIRYVNKSYLDLWGYGHKDEIIGKYASIFWKDKKKAKKIMDEIKKTGGWRGELRASKREGDIFDAYISGTLIKDESGNPIFILGSIIDISERKKAELDLAKARDSLAEQVVKKTWQILEEKKLIELIINTISDGILVLDRDGKLYLINNILKEYLWELFQMDLAKGYDFTIPSENLFIKTIRALYFSNKSKTITIEPRPGIFLQCVSERKRVRKYTSLGAVIEVRDVSQFVEFDNMRKRFVSTASHELRTPISAIIQSIRNLKKYKERLSAKQEEELITIMTQNADLLAELVEDLLTISRIDENKLRLEWNQYRPSELVNLVLNQLEPRRRKKNIQVKLDMDYDAILYGDSKKVSQIFRIFIDNAIKYSKENSKIEISINDNYMGQFNSQGTEGVLIQFTDHGMGIREEEMGFLFNRFFRSKDVQDIPGTGLGLSIARELTKLHYGDIFVQSEFGKGSTFSIFLPRLEKIP